MTLQRVNLDEEIWNEASEERRIEWEANIRELLHPEELEARDDIDELDIALTEQHFILSARRGGQVVAEVTLPHDLLADLIHEYVDTVRQIAHAEGHARMEALDMGKKVVHDRAGRLLKRQLRELRFGLTTSRRLFTLLLSLRVDTTRLVGVHGHRRIR